MTTIEELTKQAYDKADGNRQKAHPALIAAVNRHPDLHRGIIAKACWEELRFYTHQIRHQTLNGNGGPAPDKLRDHLKRSITRQWFELPLPTGVKLGNATDEDIRENIAFYEKQASQMRGRAKFLRAILARMRPGKTVAKSFTEKQMETIASGGTLKLAA